MSFRNRLRVAQIMADQMDWETIMAQSTVKELKENLRNASGKLEACLNELRSTLDRDADKKAYEDKITKMTEDSSMATVRLSLCLNRYEKQQLDTMALQAQLPPP